MGRSEGGGETEVKNVSAVDAEALEMGIEWGGGMIGRVTISKDGKLERVVVVGGDGNRIEGVERRMQEKGRIEKVLST